MVGPEYISISISIYLYLYLYIYIYIERERERERERDYSFLNNFDDCLKQFFFFFLIGKKQTLYIRKKEHKGPKKYTRGVQRSPNTHSPTPHPSQKPYQRNRIIYFNHLSPPPQGKQKGRFHPMVRRGLIFKNHPIPFQPQRPK